LRKALLRQLSLLGGFEQATYNWKKVKKASGKLRNRQLLSGCGFIRSWVRRRFLMM